MSCATHTGDKCMVWSPFNLLQYIAQAWEGFFRTPDLRKSARIWHGDFSYALVPNTSIRSFRNMSPVTSIAAGECYVCIFDDSRYQGQYQIIGPGEKVQVANCASVVVSTRKFSVEQVRRSAKPPQGYWELDGPVYLMNFSAAYRYA